jgi:hypothetical protein
VAISTQEAVDYQEAGLGDTMITAIEVTLFSIAVFFFVGWGFLELIARLVNRNRHNVLCLLGIHKYELNTDRVETATGCPVWTMTTNSCIRCGHTLWFVEKQTNEFTK